MRSNIINAKECPNCGSSWDGGSIIESFITQRGLGSTMWKDMSDADIQKYVEDHYSPPYRWGRQITIELPYDHPDHYDGVSYVKCPDCQVTFNRFTGKKEDI